MIEFLGIIAYRSDLIFLREMKIEGVRKKTEMKYDPFHQRKKYIFENIFTTQ